MTDVAGTRAGRRTRGVWTALAAVASVALFAALVPGTSSAYTARITNSTNTAASATYFTCTDSYAADKGTALFQLPLTEAAGSTTATDVASGTGTGTNPGTYYGTMSTTTDRGCPRDAVTSYSLDGTTAYAIAKPSVVNPTTFSAEIWFKTSIGQGKLIGFGNNRTTTSGQYDRHLYLSTNGAVNFGTYSSTTQVITSAPGFADNKWHHVVGTLSPTAGMVLYIDGAVVASNPAFTTGENYTGYWHIGYDSLSGWPNATTPFYFKGNLRYAAVYNSVLTPAQISRHYISGRIAP